MKIKTINEAILTIAHKTGQEVRKLQDKTYILEGKFILNKDELFKYAGQVNR